jgi:hypothetical protein
MPTKVMKSLLDPLVHFKGCYKYDNVACPFVDETPVLHSVLVLVIAIQRVFLEQTERVLLQLKSRDECPRRPLRHTKGILPPKSLEEFVQQ